MTLSLVLAGRLVSQRRRHPRRRRHARPEHLSAPRPPRGHFQPARPRWVRDDRTARVVRDGCLFRSDELHALTDADLEVISDLGIRVLFDLRNDVERVAQAEPGAAMASSCTSVRRRRPKATRSGSRTQIAHGHHAPARRRRVRRGLRACCSRYLAADVASHRRTRGRRRRAPLLVPLRRRQGPHRYHRGDPARPARSRLTKRSSTTTNSPRSSGPPPASSRLRRVPRRTRRRRRPHSSTHLGPSPGPPNRASTTSTPNYGSYDTYALEVLGVAPETLNRLRSALLA